MKHLSTWLGLVLLTGMLWAQAAMAGPGVDLQIVCDNKELTQTVSDSVTKLLPRLQQLIGVSPKHMKIVVASSKAEFLRLVKQVEGPDWAAGLAVPDRNLILLRSPGQLINPGGFEVLIGHEMLHLFFHAALGKEQAPLWLEEGLAMHLSGDSSLERAWTMSRAVLMGSLIPFERLEHTFPSEAGKTRLAYTQSYYFVGFLLDRYGEGATAELLRGLAQGRDVSGVLHEMTGHGLVGLEKAFQDEMDSRFSWLMVLFSSSVLWGVAALVAAVGLVLRRRAQLKERRMAPGPEPLVELHGPIRKWPPPKKSAELLKEAGLAQKARAKVTE